MSTRSVLSPVSERLGTTNGSKRTNCSGVVSVRVAAHVPDCRRRPPAPASPRARRRRRARGAASSARAAREGAASPGRGSELPGAHLHLQHLARRWARGPCCGRSPPRPRGPAPRRPRPGPGLPRARPPAVSTAEPRRASSSALIARLSLTCSCELELPLQVVEPGERDVGLRSGDGDRLLFHGELGPQVTDVEREERIAAPSRVWPAVTKHLLDHRRQRRADRDVLGARFHQADRGDGRSGSRTPAAGTEDRVDSRRGWVRAMEKVAQSAARTPRTGQGKSFHA